MPRPMPYCSAKSG